MWRYIHIPPYIFMAWCLIKLENKIPTIASLKRKEGRRTCTEMLTFNNFIAVF
jgi:hypothetical protein